MKSFSFYASALLLGLGTLLGACQKEQDATPQPTNGTQHAYNANAPAVVNRFLQPTQGVYIFTDFTIKYPFDLNLFVSGRDLPSDTKREGPAFLLDLVSSPGSVPVSFLISPKVNGAYRSMVTIDQTEANALRAAGWQQLDTYPGRYGYAWASPRTGWVPLYRLYSPARGHVFTTNAAERNTFISLGYQPEPAGTVGLACYVLSTTP